CTTLSPIGTTVTTGVDYW
nr:immunoglobulin heavy chain junction region [Macaca mulatta]MOY19752.1 immunoglobulin heavy chain junction region [Macaca mulatta]MOY19989.1 immunoglobulin heavy chain junction region [Macaca mulatta]MOY20002.1 immunoglobulin heavy chain junction region [Macaca mulatta]